MHNTAYTVITNILYYFIIIKNKTETKSTHLFTQHTVPEAKTLKTIFH